MITSYIIYTLILYYFFSPSLLLTSCLCNIQWRWASNCSVFLLQLFFLNASCFMRQWSSNSHLHPSNWVSFSRLEASDRVHFVFWARSRVSGRSRAHLFFLFFRFQIRFASRVKVVHSAKESWQRDLIPRPPREYTEVVHSPPRPPCLDWLPFFGYFVQYFSSHISSQL